MVFIAFKKIGSFFMALFEKMLQCDNHWKQRRDEKIDLIQMNVDHFLFEVIKQFAGKKHVLGCLVFF